jgi:hypothetical protein
MSARRRTVAALAALTLAVTACGGTAATAAPTGAALVARTPTVNPTPSVTVTPTPRPTARPTASPTSTPTPTAVPFRTGRIVLDDERIAFTLPKGWTEIPLDGAMLDQILTAVPKDMFTDQQIQMMRSAVAFGMKFTAYQLKGSGRFSNVNLVTVPVEIPLDTMKSLVQAQLKQIKQIRKPVFDAVKVAGVKALRVRYSMDLPVRGGTLRAKGVQLYVVANDRTYTITVTLTPDSRVEAADIFRTIDLTP